MASVRSVTLASILMRSAARSIATGTAAITGTGNASTGAGAAECVSWATGVTARATSLFRLAEIRERGSVRILFGEARLVGGTGFATGTDTEISFSTAYNAEASGALGAAKEAMAAGAAARRKCDTTARPAGTLPPANKITEAKAQTSRD